jgi:DNA-binding response OmpR family regulator
MNKTILVVDDEAPIRDLLEQMFEEAGYEVVTAESGEAALSELEKENIQVIFSDLKMPGMSGMDLCRRIRERNAIACVYAMTGFSSLFDLAECRDAGFDDYFLKPFEIATLLKAADDAFDKLSRWTVR